MAYVYRHIRLDKNIPFYIGIGSDNLGRYSRAIATKSRNRYWRHIVNITEYEVEILVDDISWEEAGRKEVEFIKLYGRFNINKGPLCNLTDGGDKGVFGMIFSDETKSKMSASRTGKYFISKEGARKLIEFHTGRKRPKETGEKISKAKKGKKMGSDNPFYNRNHSEESIRKMSEAQLGERHWAYGKRGEDCHNFGKKHTDETKKKMSEGRTGEKNGFYGKKVSQESKNKIKSKRGFPDIIKYDYLMNEIDKYSSVTEAAIKNGMDRHMVSNACKSMKPYKGFFWRHDNNKKIND